MTTGGQPLVVCVLLNWNGAEDTIACLASLFAQDYANLQVLVVDNASTDDSPARMQSSFPGVEVVVAESNRGFAAGCNLGTAIALKRGADFVWLLNNDTFAPPDTLTKLVAAVDTRVGLVGTVLRYMHDPAKVQAWGGGRTSRWLGYTSHAHAPAPMGPDSFLTFASVLLRAEMLRGVGLLDEGFFMYFEDSDLCFRAMNAGWTLAVADETGVLHKEGGSEKAARSSRKDRIVTASGLRFLRRHGRPWGAAMVLYVLSRLGKRLLHADFPGAGAVLGGILDWWRTPPEVLHGSSSKAR